MSPHNVVAVGDAENDHALLASAEFAVAVANAVPTLKQRADLVTAGAAGAGVRELCDRMIAGDLADLAPRLGRHDIPFGTDDRGAEVRLPAHTRTKLVAGPTAAATSAMAGLVELNPPAGTMRGSCCRRRTMRCITGTIVVGDAATCLDRPRSRPRWFTLQTRSMPARGRRRRSPAPLRIAAVAAVEMRARTGGPHWIVIDEARSAVRRRELRRRHAPRICWA